MAGGEAVGSGGASMSGGGAASERSSGGTGGGASLTGNSTCDFSAPMCGCTLL